MRSGKALREFRQTANGKNIRTHCKLVSVHGIRIVVTEICAGCPLQQHGGALRAAGQAGREAVVAAAEAALAVLQSPAAPRDLVGAATVTVTAAAAFPAVPLCQLGAVIAAGLFPESHTQVCIRAIFACLKLGIA